MEAATKPKNFSTLTALICIGFGIRRFRKELATSIDIDWQLVDCLALLGASDVGSASSERVHVADEFVRTSCSFHLF
jgi:hypothetical protein